MRHQLFLSIVIQFTSSQAQTKMGKTKYYMYPFKIYIIDRSGAQMLNCKTYSRAVQTILSRASDGLMPSSIRSQPA
jgi:hypothetical protein